MQDESIVSVEICCKMKRILFLKKLQRMHWNSFSDIEVAMKYECLIANYVFAIDSIAGGIAGDFMSRMSTNKIGEWDNALDDTLKEIGIDQREIDFSTDSSKREM